VPTLTSDQRNQLERVVIEARESAEAGSRNALEILAIHHHDPYIHMQRAERELRNQLRAKARQLGDHRLPKPNSNGQDHEIDHLVSECAYEHWHRMLFARFLAENSLLIEPQENQAISLAEAEELAKEDGVNVWVFASRCAQSMLPQIFRPDDPLLKIAFAPEYMLKLESLLASLPQALFTASDALGWVYQYWQSKKKDEVNRSEVKIGADEISAVTQLFTEPYMVQFLLQNTLGAWWAGKKLGKENASAETEDELRQKIALADIRWEYLRFVHVAQGADKRWLPAAGTFDGWPKTAKEIKILDPCCGSGHFLVAALHLLVPIRVTEEGLSATQAVDAVLRDNLHGLEIDERCCQIAAFALAFAAWTYSGAGGYRPLPNLHIACTGVGPQWPQEQWLKAELSGISSGTVGREAINNGLLNLHRLFSQAPILGSLISPAELQSDMFASDYETIQPYLVAILSAEKTDDETRERAVAASGMAKAADLLTGKYSLVVTNVPFLFRNKQCDAMQTYCDAQFPKSKYDLSTTFLERCISFCSPDGVIAIVIPQNWLFLTSYSPLRRSLLEQHRWNAIARLGPAAFQDMNWWAANTQLLILSKTAPTSQCCLAQIDVSGTRDSLAKGPLLIQEKVHHSFQSAQLMNPDSRITLEPLGAGSLLENYASSLQGVSTADNPRFQAMFWEFSERPNGWVFHQGSVHETILYGGKEGILRLDQLMSEAAQLGAAIRGQQAWGHRGVVVRQMRHLPATLGTGESFDTNVALLVPGDASDLPAIWAFCSSEHYQTAVRMVDQKSSVTNATLVKVPFDATHWRELAEKAYPDGLMEPESNDPTQWLFHGRPEESIAPLQVAMARLLGYRWPSELDDKMPLSKRARALVKRCDELAKYADDKGIVCIPSVRGEEPAADRLLALLNAAGIKPAKVSELTSGVDLDDWLRTNYFEEHCKLFHDRPFVWHIWDGRKRDGFHALINYHKLCEADGKGRKLLESLTYSYLGEWVTRQRDGVKRGESGAEDRLAMALELQRRLEAILAGEPPLDLFVRWKPLAKQPIGWEPDINDGARINIRPFLASDLPSGRSGAGVLRWKPNIKWTKDRGKEPERPKAQYPWFWGWDEKTKDFMGSSRFDSNRHNDCHYSNKAKQAARDARKGQKRD
jgi:nucleotide-binding universal stress UspA family protein